MTEFTTDVFSVILCSLFGIHSHTQVMIEVFECVNLTLAKNNAN